MPSSDKPHVRIWTDGGCKPNPGPGGWGVILRCSGFDREMYGGEPDTTNNRMELTAAAVALEELNRPCLVDIHTDSRYVRDGISSWIVSWKKRGWKTANGKAVSNQDLWIRLDKAAAVHEVTWHWVKAHAGHVDNERVDDLATQGRIETEEMIGQEG